MNSKGNGYTDGAHLNRATTTGGHVADNSQYGFPIQHRKLAAPLPIGLFAFATTTFWCVCASEGGSRAGRG